MAIRCKNADGDVIFKAGGIGVSTLSMVIEVLFVFAFTCFLMFKFASFRSKSIFCHVIIFIGWLLAVSTLAFAPIDVSMSYYETCVCHHAGDSDHLDPVEKCNSLLPANYVDLDILYVLFTIIYWAIFFGTWILYPFMMSYISCAEFTFWRKCKMAVKDNIIFYLIALVLGCLLLIFVCSTTPNFKVSYFIDIVMVMSNSWCLFLIVCLMGLGFVQVPQLCWNLSNLNRRLSYHLFTVGRLYERYGRSYKKLQDNLYLIKKVQNSIMPSDSLYEYFLVILEKCPEEYYTIETTETSPRITYPYLVKLHDKLIKTSHEYITNESLFHKNVEQAFMLQDVIESRAQRQEDCRIPWTLQNPDRDLKRCSKFLDRVVSFMEWLYWKYMVEWMWKGAAITFTFLSAVALWSEVTMFISSLPRVSMPVFSLYYLLLWKALYPISTVLLQLIFTLILIYNALCIYHSMTRIKLFNWYQLLPHRQTDIYSLLFSASYACRIAVPIVINLMYLTGFGHKSSVFIRVMGGMNSMILFGINFNIIFPCLILFISILTLLNVWNKICYVLTCARWEVFEDDDIFEHQYITRGREILQREKTRENEMGIEYFGKYFKRPKNTRNARGQRLDINASGDKPDGQYSESAKNEDIDDDLLEYIIGNKFDEYTEFMQDNDNK